MGRGGIGRASIGWDEIEVREPCRELDPMWCGLVVWGWLLMGDDPEMDHPLLLP